VVLDDQLAVKLASDSSRARAREIRACMAPRFLATVAMTHSVMAGARNAKVSPQTVALHRREDPDFERQVVAALAHAIELLHDVTMRSAIEGDYEPVFWQGIEVGHIKKFDNRMQIELLRAHMPHLFKTPGSHAPVTSGNDNKGMIMTPERQDELIRLRREALEAMKLPEFRDAANGASVDAGNSPTSVQ